MKHFITKLSSSLLVLLLFGGAAFAQFTAEGTVTDENGTPLIGVSVAVKNTTLGAVTDINGYFSLDCPGEAATLTVSYVGYAFQEVEVTSGSANVSIVLTEDAADLNEVVVTGLASSVKRSNLANSVASVSSKELTGVTSQSQLDGALYGKFKGAEIRANSGAPGGGTSVRLRGVTSVFLDQQPLYIIDGVYVDNTTIPLGTDVVTRAAGGGNTATNQDDASNRIADIDPEDIESVEILKGASASAIYGSRAAGGVVIITTKKGRAGKTEVSFRQTVGITQATRLLGTRDWDAALVEEVFGAADAELFNQNGNLDYEEQLYGGAGFRSTSRVEVSGGNEKTTFMIGATYKDEDGIVENTGYRRGNLRANVSHKLAKWVEFDLSSYYMNSESQRGLFNNSNANSTVGYALAFQRPWIDLSPDEDGVFPASSVGSNVLETVALINNGERTNRGIMGLNFQFNVFSNDRHNVKIYAQGGLDQYAHRTTGIFPQSLSYFRDPSSLGGASISGSTIVSNYNLSAVFVHSYYSPTGISFRTQAGVLQIDQNINTVITTATGLNGSQTNIDQAANVGSFQNIENERDLGGFLQEEVNWKDRIIATVGIRADKSSNNGDQNKLYYYPKANLAVNIANFDFWNVDAINQVKLRGAFGQSGRFANFQDRFNLLNGTLIAGNSGLITNTLRGNTAVEPETQTEIEFGIDLGFLNNRISFDATYYIKSIDDLLLRAQVPTTTGYTTQVINGGALENRGVELGLNIIPVDTRNFTWRTTFNFWKNQSEVTRLDVPAFNLGGFAASLGQYRIEEGSSATQIVGLFNPEDCGTPDCSDLDPNGDGFQVFGDAEPDFNLSWVNSFDIGDFELNFLWHWKNGGDGVNLSTLLYDLGNLTWDYDETGLDPSGQMTNGEFRSSQAFVSAGPWVEDAGYLRLRELGLYYNIPREKLNDVVDVKVGVSARNLINIFDYNSYDPEVSNFGNNVLANTIEVTPYPASRTINFHIFTTF
ncbi:MAG: SusC/RagA family TonB-linked outer membrane protein [Bacteroidota bacterium]